MIPICPVCSADMKAVFSDVISQGAYQTLAYNEPYYDSNGMKHIHDSNITTNRFKCSRGHTWETKSTPTCWCGWKKKIDDENSASC